MRGKLIVIEGTDCSGKETQSKMLIERLNKENKKTAYFSFPNYDSPTGKIVGGPYLGKSYICEGWFSEKATNVDAKVSSLYYAADRKYNIGIVTKLLDEGTNVFLDRYFYSNMAHQGGKIKDKEKRFAMYQWLEDLEIGLLELPLPDIKIFLYVPYQCALELKKNRTEKLDQLEASEEHLINAQNAYLEIVAKYNFYQMEGTFNNKIRSIKDINDELYDYIKNKI
ncbi:MAG: thymidylate kinase [Bacilli bacterium]